MAVYGDGITLGLVKDVNLFLIGKEHLLGSLVRRVKRGMRTARIRTIMADTKVSPTSTIEPGLWAAAAVAVASPKASREGVEYIGWYSEGRVLREG